jgi:hypothetical protein
LCDPSQAADHQDMDESKLPPDPATPPVADTERLAEITKMSVDASRTFLEFHSGKRALRRDRE